VAGVADALAHAHERSVVHRDVKPGNVIMTADRGPVLVDFGIAVTDQVRVSEIGNFTGTPAFMSPEQIEGRGHRIDGRTDIYSLGVMFYMLLCGRPPFRAKHAAELARQIREDEPQPPRQLVPNIPAELEQVCLRAMAKRVAERYTTAADMARELRRVLEGRSAADRGERAPAAARASAKVPSAPTPRPGMERRHLTLFVLNWEARDPEGELDMDERAEIEAEFRDAAQEVIGRYEGTVLQASGNELEVCFGYPVAQEDAARRALYSAIDVRGDLARRRDEKPLDCWMSIHTGTVVVQRDEEGSVAVSGDPSNLVKRLESVTEPNEIIVTREAQRMVPGFFEFEELGEFRLRGAPEGIQLYRVEGAVSNAHALMIDEIALTPLVGRDLETGLLFDRWARVAEGIGQAVMLIGDAGLGKSRLVHVLKEHVAVTGEDPPIVEWRCSPYHRSSALYPAIEYWQRTLGFAHDDSPQDQRERLKEYLRGFDLDLQEAVPLALDLLGLPSDEEFGPLDVGSQRQKEMTIGLIGQWLSAKAAREPLLFIVEDLHWVDPSSLDLLSSLVENPPAEPMLNVFTFRPEFTTPWTSSAHQTQIALNRLTRAQIGEMIRNRAEIEQLPQQFVDHVVDRTDGVPLFVEELTKALVESGALAEMADPTEVSLGTRDSMDTLSRLTIPDSLQDLLMARLDRLMGSNDVVQTAAAIGREFRVELLGAALKMPEEELAAELERLTEAEILYRRGRPPNAVYVFKHALIQDAAYESMVSKKRRHVHQSIGSALAERFAEVVAREPEVQAHHLAEAGLLEESLRYWEIAAMRAVEGSNYPEALSHLARAYAVLAKLPESAARDEQELRLNIPLGIATLSVKGYASPELGDIYARRYAICEQMNDDMGRLHAMWAEASWRIVRDEMDLSEKIGERMVALAETMDDDGGRMEARFIVAIVAFYRGEFEKCVEWASAALDLEDRERCLWHTARLGQHSPTASYCYRALSEWQLGRPDAARRSMARALETAESIEHPFSVAFTLHHYGWLLKLMRLGNEAQRRAEEQMAISQEQGFFFWETTGMMYRAGGLVEQGRFQEARETMEIGLQRYEMTGAALGLPYYYGYLAEACLGLGDVAAAREAMEHAQRAVETSNERFHEPEVHRLLGVVELAAGNTQLGESHLDRSLELARAAGSMAWRLRTATTLARHHRTGESAAEARERLADAYGRFEEGGGTPDLVEAAELLEELS
jgi:class 3 adenylate cyclase/tetratricopeptide (TPR) repeat protein